jgi:hypothetical protein
MIRSRQFLFLAAALVFLGVATAATAAPSA